VHTERYRYAWNRNARWTLQISLMKPRSNSNSKT
jgi:hypothetical protein